MPATTLLPRLGVACLLLAGAVVGCVRGPDERLWRGRRIPLPAVELEVAWERALPFCPTRASGSGEHILFVGGEQRIALDPRTGEFVDPGTDVPEPDSDTDISWEDRRLTLDPDAGRLSAHRSENGKRIWSVATGTEIRAPLQLYRSRVLIQGLDNYVYCLGARNGYEMWRTRLSNRLVQRGAFWEDRFLVVPWGADTVTVLDMLDGSTSGGWSLGRPESRFVTGPAVSGDRVALAFGIWGGQECRALALELAAPPAPSPDRR